MNSDFIEYPSSGISITNRRLVLGVGINDADYVVCITRDGKRVHCPFYRRWKSMIERCYSPICLRKHPEYTGCSVCAEWLTFSVFKAWMKAREWDGNHLDKDLLVEGNKEYHPDKCVFVSQDINSLLCDSKKMRGKYPIGVTKHSQNKMFISRCSYQGEYIYLGSYKAPLEAHSAYKRFKSKVIREVAEQQSEPLRSALLSRVYI